MLMLPLGTPDIALVHSPTLTSLALVEQLRYTQFQSLLNQARQGNKLSFTFATTVDNPEFLRSVWNERITDAASTMPGCVTVTAIRMAM